MGIFGPPNVEKLKNKRDVKGLSGALRYRDDSAIRKNAALALAEIAPQVPGEALNTAVPGLITAFEDSDPGVITACVQALAAIGLPSMLPLISALRAPGERTREAAARAMGRISANLNEPSYLRLAIDPLVALLRDPFMPVRRAAAWALGRVSPRLDLTQRSLPGESLILALRDPASEVREAAVASLGRIGEGKAIRPLVSILEDPSPAVRKIASEALDALGWKPTNSAETALYSIARQDWNGAVDGGNAATAPLIKAIQGSDSATRIAAIRALGRTRSAEAINPLVAILRDPDEALRAAAAAALEDAGAPQAIEPLLQAIRDKDRDVRRAVARALSHTNDVRAVAPIVSLMRTRDAETIETTSEALVRLGALSVPALLPILSEPDTILQNTAGDILVKIGSPAVQPLIDMLREGTTATNRLVARLLGEIHDSRAVWPLVTALNSPDLAIAAINALGQIGDARAVRALLEQLNAFSEPIQQAAALALGAIGDQQAVDPLLQLLRASERQTRIEAAKALMHMYRSGKLDLSQKRKILEQQDRFTDKHNDVSSHQDETHGPDWHTDLPMHEDTGIGLDFPPSPPYK